MQSWRIEEEKNNLVRLIDFVIKKAYVPCLRFGYPIVGWESVKQIVLPSDKIYRLCLMFTVTWLSTPSNFSIGQKITSRDYFKLVFNDFLNSKTCKCPQLSMSKLLCSTASLESKRKCKENQNTTSHLINKRYMTTSKSYKYT